MIERKDTNLTIRKDTIKVFDKGLRGLKVLAVNSKVSLHPSEIRLKQNILTTKFIDPMNSKKGRQ